MPNNPNQPQQAPPNQAGQPQQAGDLHARAATAGFDMTKFFDFIKGLDWATIIALVRTIWSTWLGAAGARPRMAAAPGTAAPRQDLECAKLHATLIRETSDCLLHCLGGATGFEPPDGQQPGGPPASPR